MRSWAVRGGCESRGRSRSVDSTVSLASSDPAVLTVPETATIPQAGTT